MSPARKLREILERPQGTISMGVFDCISARIVEEAGYQLGSISGNAMTASLLGFPDVGLSTQTEVVAQSRNIARSVSIPLIADADNGFGGVLNVIRTVQEFEAAGIAGIQIEDQASPRRSSTVGPPLLVPVDEFAARIRAASEARRDKDFVIIARTDSRLAEDFDSAIARMRAYIAAGADAAFYSSLQDIDELRAAVAQTPAPIKLNVIEGYPPARFATDELLELGFKIVSYSGVTQRSSMRAMREALAILETERSTEKTLRTMALSPEERSKVLRVNEFKGLERRYTANAS